MKNCFTSFILGSLLIVGALTGCEKENDNSIPDPAAGYMDLQVGKYVRYLLDSTRYVAFGQKDTVISYQAKDVVDAAITDGTGRAGYRIIRYLRAVNSTNEADWKPTLTYQVIPSRQNVEVLENNFRYIKLSMPIQEGLTWRGNSYLPTDPYRDIYPFSNDQDIQKWDYTYQDVYTTLNINNVDYDSTISILQAADSVNVDIPDAAGGKTYWMEKYAKSVGLIYKEVVMWERQPPDSLHVGYLHGFGIKMSILDHN